MLSIWVRMTGSGKIACAFNLRRNGVQVTWSTDFMPSWDGCEVAGVRGSLKVLTQHLQRKPPWKSNKTGKAHIMIRQKAEAHMDLEI
jgi:hypothetical protein